MNAIVTMLCDRDAALYPLHRESLEDVWPADTEYFISADKDNPPVGIKYETTHLFNSPTRPGERVSIPQHARSVMKAMDDVRKMCPEADYIIRMDADCIHLDSEWFFGAVEEKRHPLVGFSQNSRPSAAYGAAMAIRADVVEKLAELPFDITMRESPGEDTVLSDQVRKEYPNGLFLHGLYKDCKLNDWRRFRGWDGPETNYQKHQVIHLGQKVDREAGEEILSNMKLVWNDRNG